MVERIQDEYDNGAKLVTYDIIKRATIKYNNLVNRGTYEYKSTDKKYLNFSTDSQSPPPDIKNSWLQALPEWRKKKIPGKETIERDGKTYYFCPHHKNDSLGYPDGLYVCSHRPEQHDEYMAHRKKNKPFKINKSPDAAAKDPEKKLMMLDNIRKVLTTTQPHLDSAQINKLLDQVSKE